MYDKPRPSAKHSAGWSKADLRRRYELALYGAADGLWHWEPGSNLVWYSTRFRELLGYEGDDEEGFPSTLEAFNSHLHPDDHDRTWAAVNRHLESDDPFDVEYRLRTKSGPWRWFRARGKCLRDAEGNVSSMAGSVQDVQQLHEALEGLRESEQQLDTALSNGNVGLWDWNIAEDAVYFSPQAKVQLGYAPDEGWGSYMDWEGRLHPDDRDSAVQLVKDYLERRADEYISIFRLRHRDGSYRWIQSQGQARWDEQGKPLRMIGVHVDITRQKDLETELQRANAELRKEQFLLTSLVDNTPDPIFFKDREGRFVRVNQRMAIDVGVEDPADLIGKTDREAWGEEFGEETLLDEQRILETGEPLINKEENPVSHDGREKWVLVTKLPLRNERNEIVGTFGIARNITELKRHEQDLERMNRELSRSNEELENFAYVASHDLRTPLRNIDSLTQWILEDAGDVLPPQSREDLMLLRQRVDLMNRLLNDLLQLSRVGRAESDPELLDPAEVIDEVLSLLVPPASFTVVVQPRMPKVYAPRSALRHVFQNLIDNAIKHHDRPDGRVEVTAESLPGFVQFEVRDDGPGIDPRFHQKVFQIFQTLQRRDERESSGMGLAVVKKTVETFGGEITLESDGERGCAFRFTWRQQ